MRKLGVITLLALALAVGLGSISLGTLSVGAVGPATAFEPPNPC
jgi:hypothetical protein